MSIRTCHEDVEILAKRKDTVVLEENLRLEGSLVSKLCMSLACELRIILEHCIRLVEETEAELQTKNAAYSIVDT